jgi:predicted HTH transcriptional regulator
LDTSAWFNAIGAREPSPAGQIDKLKQDRLIDDAGAASYSIRRIGALLLAKDLRQFPDFEFKRPRVIVYPGTSRIDASIDDVHGQLGYSIGFSRLLKYIMRSLPHEEVFRNGLRKRIPLVPEVIIRELLANALVHQDFSIGGTAVRIEIFKNRVEVSNPGEPIVELNRLIDGARSRNERLADLMRRFGICEERGSGIDKVVDATESLHLTPPHFRVADGRFIATIHGPKSFQEMDRGDRIRACHQHCALKWEMTLPMTNQTLRTRFQIPENKPYLVSHVIKDTVAEGLIKLDTDGAGSSKKFAKYVPSWV